jgi:hypothetical protein
LWPWFGKCGPQLPKCALRWQSAHYCGHCSGKGPPGRSSVPLSSETATRDSSASNAEGQRTGHEGYRLGPICLPCPCLIPRKAFLGQNLAYRGKVFRGWAPGRRWISAHPKWPQIAPCSRAFRHFAWLETTAVEASASNGFQKHGFCCHTTPPMSTDAPSLSVMEHLPQRQHSEPPIQAIA